MVADDRESAGGLLDRLRAQTNDFRLEVQRLEFGDFEIGQHIVVERRRVADFAASVIDGRLFRLAAGLAGGGRPGVLILEGHGELPPGGYRPTGSRARQSFVLQGLPGVGPHRADALLTRFGSIEKVARASITDLASVPGIGGQIAAKIRWVLE